MFCSIVHKLPLNGEALMAARSETPTPHPLCSSHWWLNIKMQFAYIRTECIRYLWQLKTAAFLQRCLIHSVLLYANCLYMVSHQSLLGLKPQPPTLYAAVIGGSTYRISLHTIEQNILDICGSLRQLLSCRGV